ncbi:MAG: hypothetical protein TEF_17270 [Rhizobiales bacterium NRL2]|jgi:hypothetical protein|nr:MAG: hypothetical protein TEF_17270 [Rhizobiales bacterium NRL2]
MSARRILFVTYGGGHADIVRHVYPLLRADPRFDPLVLALTNAPQILRPHKVPYRQVSDYLPMAGYEDALQIGRELAEPFWEPSSGVSFEESCAYLGVSMTDLIAERGETAAREAYGREGRRVFQPTRFLDRVFEQERPAAVVVTCLVRMELAAMRVARARGVPGILIEDHYGYGMLGERPLEENCVQIASDDRPSQIGVLNDFVRARMLKAGLPSHSVRVTGQPVFAHWRREFQDAVPLELPTDSRPLVTYMTPGHRGHLASQVRVIGELAAKTADRWRFAVKLHPSIGLDEFRREFPAVAERVLLLRDEDIVSVVKASDAVIVFRSTVGLLAIFNGVSLVVWDSTGEKSILPYDRSPVAHVVRHDADLEAAVAACLVRKRRAVDADDAFDCPPDAVQRIAVLLAEVTSATSMAQ